MAFILVSWLQIPSERQRLTPTLQTQSDTKPAPGKRALAAPGTHPTLSQTTALLTLGSCPTCQGCLPSRPLQLLQRKAQVNVTAPTPSLPQMRYLLPTPQASPRTLHDGQTSVELILLSMPTTNLKMSHRRKRAPTYGLCSSALGPAHSRPCWIPRGRTVLTQQLFYVILCL